MTKRRFMYLVVFAILISILVWELDIGGVRSTKPEESKIAIAPDGRVIPLTVLTTTDSKRLCVDCHKK